MLAAVDVRYFCVTDDRIFTAFQQHVHVWPLKLITAPDWFLDCKTREGAELQMSAGHDIEEKSVMGINILMFLSTFGLAEPAKVILEKAAAMSNMSYNLDTDVDGDSALRIALQNKRWSYLIEMAALLRKRTPKKILKVKFASSGDDSR